MAQSNKPMAPRQVTRLNTMRSLDNQNLTASIESVYPDSLGDWTNYGPPQLVLSTNNNRVPGSNESSYVSIRIGLGYNELNSIIKKVSAARLNGRLEHTEYSGRRSITFRLQTFDQKPNFIITIMDPNANAGAQKAVLRFSIGAVEGFVDLLKQYTTNYVAICSNSTTSIISEWNLRSYRTTTKITESNTKTTNQLLDRMTDILENISSGVEALCNDRVDMGPLVQGINDTTKAVMMQTEVLNNMMANTGWGGLAQEEEISDEERQRRAIEDEEYDLRTYYSPPVEDTAGVSENDDLYEEEPVQEESNIIQFTPAPVVEEVTPEPEPEPEVIPEPVKVSSDPTLDAEWEAAFGEKKELTFAEMLSQEVENRTFEKIDLGIDPGVQQKLEELSTKKSVESKPKKVMAPMPFIGDVLLSDPTMGPSTFVMVLNTNETADPTLFFPFSGMLSMSSVVDAPFNFLKIESDTDANWLLVQGIMNTMFRTVVREYLQTGKMPNHPAVKYETRFIPEPGTIYYKYMLEVMFAAIVYRNFSKSYLRYVESVNNKDYMDVNYKLCAVMLNWFYGQLFYHMAQRHTDGYSGVVAELSKVFDACVENGFMEKLAGVYSEFSYGGVMDMNFQDIRTGFYELMTYHEGVFENDYFVKGKEGGKEPIWIDITEFKNARKEWGNKLPTLEDLKGTIIKSLNLAPAAEEKADPRLVLLFTCIENYMDDKLALERLKANVKKYSEFACAVEDMKIDVPDMVRKIRRTMDNNPNLTMRAEVLRKAKALEL